MNLFTTCITYCFSTNSVFNTYINLWNSFYPLYPPAEDIPLDFKLALEALHISSIPDIIILPSDMKYFVKVSHFMPNNSISQLQFHLKKENRAYIYLNASITLMEIET